MIKDGRFLIIDGGDGWELLSGCKVSEPSRTDDPASFIYYRNTCVGIIDWDDGVWPHAGLPDHLCDLVKANGLRMLIMCDDKRRLQIEKIDAAREAADSSALANAIAALGGDA